MLNIILFTFIVEFLVTTPSCRFVCHFVDTQTVTFQEGFDPKWQQTYAVIVSKSFTLQMWSTASWSWMQHSCPVCLVKEKILALIVVIQEHNFQLLLPVSV